MTSARRLPDWPSQVSFAEKLKSQRMPTDEITTFGTLAEGLLSSALQIDSAAEIAATLLSSGIIAAQLHRQLISNLRRFPDSILRGKASVLLGRGDGNFQMVREPRSVTPARRSAQ
jgi:hypothetical protein